MKIFQSRHLAQARSLERRTFLKAVGLGIAAPLAYKMSRLAVAQSGARPTRMFLMFLPHGVPMEHYEVGTGMDFGMSGEGILTPLEPYRGHVQVLRGVGNTVANNHAAIATVLTGAATSNSIDFEVAQQLQTTPHVLGMHPLWPGAGSVDSNAYLARHGSWVSPIANPADALSDLFPGVVTAPVNEQPVVDEAAFRNEALTLTEGEVAAMQASLQGLTAETNKLQVHLDSLAALKSSLSGGGGLGASSCNGRPAMPTAESMTGKDPNAAENLAAVYDGHLEAAANAFLCGTARVVTLQIMHVSAPIMMNFVGGPGVAKAHHDPISHSWDAAGRAEFARVQRWFYSRLAEKFLAVLDQDDPFDPGRKVLDNMSILVTSEISDGANHHSDHSDMWLDGAPMNTYLPWVLIGGGGGYFSPGKAVNLTKEDHRNVLAAVAESMGTPLLTVGGANVVPTAGVRA